MYARLRGVPEVIIADVVEDLIQSLLLQDHADKLASSYRYVLTGLVFIVMLSIKWKQKYILQQGRLPQLCFKVCGITWKILQVNRH